VFVRSGCFVRTADATSAVLDPTRAYCITPGQEQRYDHPHAGGDDCTSVVLAPALLASMWGGDPTLPSGCLPSSPRVDLEHRFLLAAAGRGEPPEALHERALSLAVTALGEVDPGRVVSGRPSTARARRVLVDAAREALAADPNLPLADLAAGLDVSATHLSRLFRAGTGHTIARHRMRLRARAALERLAGGEQHLARLAAELGFADQSHLCRVIRSETGQTPSHLRRALRAESLS
jgi:AraC-like DNA-binding protein